VSATDRAATGSGLLRAADAVCDLGCLAFAAWTLLCHVTVFTGGSLDRLLACAAVTAVLLGGAWLLCRRGRAGEPQDLEPDPRAATPRQLQAWVTATAAGIGCVLAVALAAGSNPLGLWAPAAVFLVAAAVLALWVAPDPSERPSSRATAIALWALAVAAALLTASVCRPDADDALYVSMAVAAADAPSAPLLAGDPLHGVPGVRLDFPTYRLHAFELLAGAAAHLTGVEAIAWLHLVLPPLLALIAVLAIGRAARRLAPARWLWVTAAVVVLLVGIGNAHNWYGNMAFVRLQQGKGALVTIMVPLLVAYGLELVQAPGPRTWLRLAAAQVAAVGMTATGLWVAPPVALLAATAALHRHRSATRAVALAGAASLYPLLLGAAFSVALTQPSSPLGPFLTGLKTTHTAHRAEPPPAAAPPYRSQQVLSWTVNRVFLDARLAIPCACVLLCGWWLSPEPLVRRLHLAFSAFTVMVPLNPHLVDWTLRHVTGSVHVYWRVLWTLPLPLLLALALTAPVARWPSRLGPILSVLLVGGFVALTSDHTVLGAANQTSLRPFRLKAPPELEVARALAAAVPSGAVVVAPLDVAPWVTTLHHHPYPLVVRNQYLQPLREKLGPDDITARQDMARLLSHPDARPAQVRRFLLGLDRFRVEGVCFRSSVTHRSVLTAALAALGFQSHGSVDGFEVWARTLRSRRS